MSGVEYMENPVQTSTTSRYCRDQRPCHRASAPAGFFSAYALQMAGFDVVLIEQGSEVDKRAGSIHQFEKSGNFNSKGNYAFGEGGAGTFSDGKLTSRTKRISKEKAFSTSAYINAGAPEEIAFLAYPHLGTDNLKVVVKNLRKDFINLGGQILFETRLEDLEIVHGNVQAAITAKGSLNADYFLNRHFSRLHLY